MPQSAIGIHDEKELAKIAQEVPPGCGCQTCLWASIECRQGSLYEPNETGQGDKCKAWAYYD